MHGNSTVQLLYAAESIRHCGGEPLQITNIFDETRFFARERWVPPQNSRVKSLRWRLAEWFHHNPWMRYVRTNKWCHMMPEASASTCKRCESTSIRRLRYYNFRFRTRQKPSATRWQARIIASVNHQSVLIADASTPCQQSTVDNLSDHAPVNYQLQYYTDSSLTAHDF